MAAITADAMLGMAHRFSCVIDGYDLGSWTKCTGLGVTFKYEKVAELGEHTTSANIPHRVEYPPITLQRAMVKSDWEKTKDWLQIVASAPWLLADNPVTDVAGASLVGPSSGKITLYDAALEEVATWELQNVLPQAWKGPSFDANGKLVALETLELVHEGFLVCLNA